MTIEGLLNLGPKSCRWLSEAGIDSLEQLQTLGPVVAYRIVKSQQPQASLNLLWALAAGLEGKDWRELDAQHKQRLKQQLQELDQ